MLDSQVPGRCPEQINDVRGTREGELSRLDSSGSCHGGVKFRKERRFGRKGSLKRDACLKWRPSFYNFSKVIEQNLVFKSNHFKTAALEFVIAVVLLSQFGSKEKNVSFFSFF